MRALFLVLLLSGACAGRQTRPQTLEAFCAKPENAAAPVCARRRGAAP